MFARGDGGRIHDIVMKAINSSKDFCAIPYGRSEISIETDHDKVKEYWRRYCAVEKNWKRPDVLLLPKSVVARRRGAWRSLLEDPTTTPDKKMAALLRHAICGIECENSLWKTKKMPDLNTALPLTKLGIIAPRIWVKEEDTEGLSSWNRHFHKPIFIVQVFFDRAYLVRYKKVISRARRIKKLKSKAKRNAAQKRLGIIFEDWPYADSRTGRSTNKLVYTSHHTLGIGFAKFYERPRYSSRMKTTPNGKMMPYVKFVGSRMRLTADALNLFRATRRSGQ